MADTPDINQQIEAAYEAINVNPNDIVVDGGASVASATEEQLKASNLVQTSTPTPTPTPTTDGTSNILQEVMSAPSAISGISQAKSLFTGNKPTGSGSASNTGINSPVLGGAVKNASSTTATSGTPTSGTSVTTPADSFSSPVQQVSLPQSGVHDVPFGQGVTLPQQFSNSPVGQSNGSIPQNFQLGTTYYNPASQGAPSGVITMPNGTHLVYTNPADATKDVSALQTGNLTVHYDTSNDGSQTAYLVNGGQRVSDIVEVDPNTPLEFTKTNGSWSGTDNLNPDWLGTEKGIPNPYTIIPSKVPEAITPAPYVGSPAVADPLGQQPIVSPFMTDELGQGSGPATTTISEASLPSGPTWQSWESSLPKTYTVSAPDATGATTLVPQDAAATQAAWDGTWHTQLHTYPDGTTQYTEVPDGYTLNQPTNGQPAQFVKNPPVTGLKGFLQNTKVQMGIAIAGAAISGLVFYESIKGLINNYKSIGGWIGTAGSLFGLYESFHKLLSLLPSSGLFKFMFSWPGFLIAVGALVLIALLTSKPNTTPSAQETPLVTMPTVWSSKAVVFMTAGIAMSSLGVLTGPTAPLSQTLTVSPTALTAALNSSQLTDSSGNAVGANSYALYNTLFVQSGTNGAADEVMYVTQGSNGQAVVNTVTLKSGLKFAAPSSPQAAYINFVQTNSNGTWSANPDVVQALSAQNALTTAANSVSGVSGSNAIQLAGATNKTATASTGN